MSRGYFGIGIERVKIGVNIGTLWRSAYALGADFIFTIGQRCDRQPSDTTKAWRHIPLFEFRDIEDFKNHIPYDCQPIGIELTSTAISLEKFKHPERAVYILGPEDGNLSTSVQKLCTNVLAIDSKYCLNVAAAGTVVLYDRNMKQMKSE